MVLLRPIVDFTEVRVALLELEDAIDKFCARSIGEYIEMEDVLDSRENEGKCI
jgi:hypothetical protein